MTREELQMKLDIAFTESEKIIDYKMQGSLIKGNSDKYSDIDYILDVSGTNNADFMLNLPCYLNHYLPVGYVAFAPKFAPELYLITIYFKETNIFHFVDIECIANPHFSTLSKAEIANHKFNKNVFMKLSLNCLKSVLRGNSNISEIERIHRILYKTENNELYIQKLYNCFNYFNSSIDSELKKVSLNAMKLMQEEKLV